MNRRPSTDLAVPSERFSVVGRLRHALMRYGTDERLKRAGEYLALYGRLRESVPESATHIVQFIGVEREAGTSTIAWEFAQTVASAASRNVLLIQDGHAPSDVVSEVKRSDDQPDEGSGGQAIVERSAGATALAQLAASDGPLWRMRGYQVDAILRELRSAYELVVIDSPPLAESSESLPIANKLDGVVLVVRAGRTNSDLADAAKRSLEGVGARLLGVAFNTRFA
jgi:Mrp family chromosome partitioning ATPase